MLHHARQNPSLERSTPLIRTRNLLFPKIQNPFNKRSLPMNIMVTFRHMPASDALRDHAEDKAQKFMKYLIDPVDIHVVLKVEKIRQIAEITIQSKNFTAHAVEESNDMYTSIDKVSS